MGMIVDCDHRTFIIVSIVIVISKVSASNKGHDI